MNPKQTSVSNKHTPLNQHGLNAEEQDIVISAPAELVTSSTPSSAATGTYPEATIVTGHNSTNFKPNNSVVVIPQQTTNGPIVEGPQYIPIDSRKPVLLTYCPHCARQHVSTTTRTKATSETWLCVVAGVVLFWPLCWLPLVIRSLKQTDHYCQGCGTKVGRVKPLQ